MSTNNEQVVFQPNLYVDGLLPSYDSSSTVILSPGQCRDSTNIYDMGISEEITVSTAYAGINGLDQGEVGAGAWYYLHVIGDTLGFNLPATVLSLSPTNPVLPSGYDVFRRVACVGVDGGSDLKQFTCIGQGTYRQYDWNVEFSIAKILSSGNATTYTDVSVNGFCPPVCQRITLLSGFVPHTAGNLFYLIPQNAPETALLQFSGTVASVVATNQIRMLSSFDGDTGLQTISYRVTQSTDTLSLYVIGFEDFLS